MFLERGCWSIARVFVVLARVRGEHDKGHGETDDILEIISTDSLQSILACLFMRVALVFGAQCHGESVFMPCPMEIKPKQLILCGLPTATVAGVRHYVTPQIKGDILFLMVKLTKRPCCPT